MRFCARVRWTPLWLALIVIAIPGVDAQTLNVFSGNGQVLFEQFRTNVPMVAQAKDASGQPVSGIKVKWAITHGSGTIRDTTLITDANGLVSTNFLSTSLPFGYSFQPATVTVTSASASANFTVTTVSLPNVAPENAVPPQFDLIAPPQTNRNLTGRSGSTIPGALAVQVSSGRGEALANVGMRIASYPDTTQPPPAACNGQAGIALSKSNGLVTCDLVLTGIPGSYQFTGVVGEFINTPIISLVITPGSACGFSLSTSSQSFASTAGESSVTVETTSGCSWTAASNATWITITSGSSGSGPGPVNYSIAPNTTGAARVGTMLIAGQTYTVNQSATSTPAGSLTITTSSLPSGAVESSYSATLLASGGIPPYTWSVTGVLPAGLALNPSTGAITGTPTAQGGYVLPVNVADSGGGFVSQQIPLNIAAQGSTLFSITTSSFSDGVLGQPYQQTFSTSGGCVSPFHPTPTLTLAGGTLPTGLTIGQNTGGQSIISGMPTATGTFTFTLKATDGCGNVVSATFTVLVTPTAQPVVPLAAPASLTFTVIQGSATAPQNQTISITSSGSTLAYSATPSTVSGGGWLAVISAPSGTTPGTLAIGLNPVYAGLGPATYTGTISITPQGGALPIAVPVTLNIVPAPALSLAPSSITVSLSSSLSAPSYQQNLVILSNGASIAYTVTVQTNTGWLSATPTAGITPGTATVLIAAGGLTPGSYSGMVVVTPAAGNPIKIPVTLTVTAAAPLISSVTNAASFLPGPVAPGEIIVIFGTAMGPADLTTLSVTSGRIDTKLAGTRVFFDGVPAPMIYTSSGQLSTIVPFGVAGRVSTKITVECQGLDSNPVDIQVVESNPGIFTLNATTQGAILNQNASVNSIQHGAAPESYVSIFGTGGGLTSPLSEDGTFPVAAAPVNLPVEVRIDGIKADVSYAGAAPDLPAGALQVNVKVPAGVHRGIAVPVVLTIGNVASQANVTLAVAP